MKQLPDNKWALDARLVCQRILTPLRTFFEDHAAVDDLRLKRLSELEALGQINTVRVQTPEKTGRG